MIFDWPTFKIICGTLISINFEGQIENRASDYRLLEVSSFDSRSICNL